MNSETEYDVKLERIRKLLVQYDLNVLLLSQTSNFAWATCGADSFINRADSLGVASLLITPKNRYVITTNIEANRLIEEERLHHQGGSTGYASREFTATSASTQPILIGQAFAWNPSITGTKSEDTILVGENTNEILTEIMIWPTIDIEIDGQIIKRPAILEK